MRVYLCMWVHMNLRKYIFTYESLDKFPDFFRTGIFIDSTHMAL